jgi:hypothetical protein
MCCIAIGWCELYHMTIFGSQARHFWWIFVIVNSFQVIYEPVGFRESPPGSDPTIVSCNASVVKIYYTSISLVRFEKKSIFLHFE